MSNGGTILARRQLLGITQEELAVRSACDVKTVRKAEKGGRLDLATLHRLAAALQVMTAEITHGSDDSPGMEEVNLQAALAWLDAFNRRDVEGLLVLFHADAIRHIPGSDDIPSGGTFRGIDELRQHFTESFQVFQTGRVLPENFEIHALGDFVFVRGAAEVTHIPSGRTETCYVVQEFRFQGGKIVEMYTTTDTYAFHRLVDGQAQTE